MVDFAIQLGQILSINSITSVLKEVLTIALLGVTKKQQRKKASEEKAKAKYSETEDLRSRVQDLESKCSIAGETPTRKWEK